MATAVELSGDATLYKNPQCPCCDEYVRQLERAGMSVTIETTTDLAAVKKQAGVPEALGACHTLIVGDYIIEGLDRSVTAREDRTVAPDRIVDVQFADFMADPFGAIGGIYDRFGIEYTAEAEKRMRDFLAAHPGDGYGTHRYSFADTGLDEGELRSRARRYQEYFDVPSEPRA